MLRRKSLTLVLLPLLLLCQTASARPVARSGSNEREQDGLAGPVRRVKTETAKITVKGGKPLEGPRAVLETTTYDQKGNRVDTAYYLAAGGSLTGKEVYKYDERGNIVEMTLHNDDGTLLAKEVYTYEFDAVGNWVKMTTAVAVIESGKVTFEPSEVTYRTISYYLDEAVMAKLSQPAAGAPATAAPAAAGANAPAATQPQPAAASNAPTNLQANKPAGSQTAAQTNSQTGAQSKPSSPAADAAKQAQANKPARNTAAPLAVASLDKSVMTDAGVPVSAGSNVANASAGPAVKSEGDAPAAPSAPIRTGPLKPVSGGILNGRALSLPAPSYPDAARRARASGLVEVEVVIDINGKVISAKAVRGPSLLLQAAEMAARLARFTPTLLSGQPVRVVGLINYNFSLQQ
ncbi:MAG TPA: TonB family protein [Pyrinomonadaceae bacterium]|nr:TonB family protein [Pyrinomonadaceae bacterium]